MVNYIKFLKNNSRRICGVTINNKNNFPVYYKYNLSLTLWISPLCNVYKLINEYVTDFIVTPDISHFIRELCICRDSRDVSVLKSTEIFQLISEYICTI